jgi:UDP:flavonoid glycosyltransferase YjiC (YdhE family)
MASLRRACLDCGMNAEAVQEQGAGIGIPLNAADKATVEGALTALLNEPRFRKAAFSWSEALKGERAVTPSKICDTICAIA